MVQAEAVTSDYVSSSQVSTVHLLQQETVFNPQLLLDSFIHSYNFLVSTHTQNSLLQKHDLKPSFFFFFRHWTVASLLTC